MRNWIVIFVLIAIYFSVGAARAQVYDHHSFQKFKNPERDFAIVVTPEGYYPDRLILFEGEKVQFFVTSTSADAGCLIVENHSLFLPATKGRLSEGTVVFDQAGEFNYYCPSYNHKGKIVVLGERQRAQPLVKVNRDIASEKTDTQTVDGWVPKEY